MACPARRFMLGIVVAHLTLSACASASGSTWADAPPSGSADGPADGVHPGEARLPGQPTTSFDCGLHFMLAPDGTCVPFGDIHGDGERVGAGQPVGEPRCSSVAPEVKDSELRAYRQAMGRKAGELYGAGSVEEGTLYRANQRMLALLDDEPESLRDYLRSLRALRAPLDAFADEDWFVAELHDSQVAVRIALTQRAAYPDFARQQLAASLVRHFAPWGLVLVGDGTGLDDGRYYVHEDELTVVAEHGIERYGEASRVFQVERVLAADLGALRALAHVAEGMADRLEVGAWAGRSPEELERTLHRVLADERLELQRAHFILQGSPDIDGFIQDFPLAAALVLAEDEGFFRAYCAITAPWLPLPHWAQVLSRVAPFGLAWAAYALSFAVLPLSVAVVASNLVYYAVLLASYYALGDVIDPAPPDPMADLGHLDSLSEETAWLTHLHATLDGVLEHRLTPRQALRRLAAHPR